MKGNWSPEALARVEATLQSRPLPPCRCGATDFTLDTALAAIPTMPADPGDGSIKVGPVFALVYLECKRCHEVRLYNAKGLGAID